MMLKTSDQRLKPVSEWGNDESFTEYGSKCIQSDGTGSEDCLFMNILVPGEPIPASADAALPVLVFIHGGAFKDDNGEGKLISEEFQLYENDGRGQGYTNVLFGSIACKTLCRTFN